MSQDNFVQPRVVVKTVAVVLTAMLMFTASSAFAGGNFFRQGAVGGVSIDPEGVLREPDLNVRERVADRLRLDTAKAPADLTAPVALRMVSLRGLEEAIRDAMRDKIDLADLPEEIRFVGGLQRIQYVFLYPETNDIVLAGPGEGWRVDDKANVVGITTGRPVIQLDDLLVAFRTVNAAREGQGISCSIDPTAEGRQNFQNYMNSISTINQFDRQTAERAMGPQQITLTGVPATSHFARVMVASDFRMKRYAMNLEKSPVKDLPSFIDLLKTNRGKLTDAMPRWWLACNYDGVAHSEDGLAWELRGPGVKVMTEDDFIAADGGVRGAGRANPVAQKWADLMTEKYDELTREDPVFGELRNLMDLSVVAALIKKHDLRAKVGCELPLITSQQSDLAIEEWNAPKSVDTQCSLTKAGREFIITASGGVQITSWETASKSMMSEEVSDAYTKASATKKQGWRWQ